MKICVLIFRYFLGKPDGRKKAKIRNLRWLDCIEMDVKLRDVKRWGKKSDLQGISLRRKESLKLYELKPMMKSLFRYVTKKKA